MALASKQPHNNNNNSKKKAVRGGRETVPNCNIDLCTIIAPDVGKKTLESLFVEKESNFLERKTVKRKDGLFSPLLLLPPPLPFTGKRNCSQSGLPAPVIKRRKKRKRRRKRRKRKRRKRKRRRRRKKRRRRRLVAFKKANSPFFHSMHFPLLFFKCKKRKCIQDVPEKVEYFFALYPLL